MHHDHEPKSENPAHTPEPRWPIGLEEGLRDRLSEANDADSLISGDDARTIAACLCDFLSTAADSALRRFVADGQLDAIGVRAECLNARAAGQLTPQLRRWAAWLTTYAARALPPGQGGHDIPPSGDALDAFLTLPDIDPSSDAVFDQFAQTYCGTYADVDAVLDGITDIVEWERHIGRLADTLGIREFVSVDRQAIESFVRDSWDIIPRYGRLHVFAR
jgi:hypothetical protein